jgi:hypothetical protein
MKIAAVFLFVAPCCLMMEAASTSETSLNFYQATRRYNPEDSHLHNYSADQEVPCFCGSRNFVTAVKEAFYWIHN